MKQKILEALRAKFVGVSDSILDKLATKLAMSVTTDEQVKTAVDGVTIQQVIESYGDSRATQAQQTAVHNYEQKYGLKDGQKQGGTGAQQDGTHSGQQQQSGGQGANGQQQDNGGQQADVPAWAKTLIETNKKLEERLNGMEQQKTTDIRRQQINTLIEKLPENLQKAYQRTNVESLTEEEFTTLKGDITNEVSAIQSQIAQKGAVFGKPSVQTTGGTGNELSKEQIDAIGKRNNTIDTNAQPF